MMSRNLLAALLAPMVAGGAFAQTPVGPDPLCAGLESVLGAGAEQIPFIILVPADQSIGSLPRLKQKPLGFDDFDNCQLYRAGNAKQGTNGGGPHNYVRCNAFYKTTTDANTAEVAEAAAASSEAYEKLAVRTKACLEPKGWTASGGERVRRYEDHDTILTFTHPDTANDVVLRLIEDGASPGSRSWTTTRTVDLSVRNPNPNHPKPQ